MPNIEWDKNAQQFFNRWLETLHQNCKKMDHCLCHDGAFRLTVHELEARRHGKPSLPLHIEDQVWDIAFDHHREHCEKKAVEGWSAGSISPDWALPKRPHTCDCFDVALTLHKAEEAVALKPVVTQLDDMSYERVI